MIGELIKDARRRAGMTQDSLALRAGIRAGNVSRLERRELGSCQVRTLQKIATALGLELVIQMREPEAIVSQREPFVTLKKIREDLDAATGQTPERLGLDVGNAPMPRKLTGAALRNAGRPVIKAPRAVVMDEGQTLVKDPERW